MDAFATPLASAATAAILIVDALSVGVLLLATFEYLIIIANQRAFFSAIGYAQALRSALWQRFLLILYVCAVLALTTAFTILFFLRPHFL